MTPARKPMQVTFELPDEVVTQLQPFEDKLPQILGLGLREFKAIAQEGFSGMAEVLEFLASLPNPEAIIALRPTEVYAPREKSHRGFDSRRGTAMATLSIFRAYCQNGES